MNLPKFKIIILKHFTPLQLLSLWIVVVCFISLLVFLQDIFMDKYSLPLVITSFGASAVILFALPTSPFARARALIGGHTLSALIGVTCFQLLGDSIFATGISVATALVVMLVTDTLHPPAGATALTAIIGGSGVHELAYLYVLFPCAVGSIFMYCFCYLYHSLSNKYIKLSLKNKS